MQIRSVWTVLSAVTLNLLLLPLQMKDKYANAKPYGAWLEAQVATLPDLVESVSEHLLKVATIHSGHNRLDATPVSQSNAKGSNGKGSNGKGSKGKGSNGKSGNGQANGQGSSGAPDGSPDTLSSSHEGGQLGVNASNGHSNGGAGQPQPCSSTPAHAHNMSAMLSSSICCVLHRYV